MVFAAMIAGEQAGTRRASLCGNIRKAGTGTSSVDVDAEA